MCQDKKRCFKNVSPPRSARACPSQTSSARGNISPHRSARACPSQTFTKTKKLWTFYPIFAIITQNVQTPQQERYAILRCSSESVGCDCPRATGQNQVLCSGSPEPALLSVVQARLSPNKSRAFGITARTSAVLNLQRRTMMPPDKRTP